VPYLAIGDFFVVDAEFFWLFCSPLFWLFVLPLILVVCEKMSECC
jgi:hypothetical protein